jgi:hypothetical protein
MAAIVKKILLRALQYRFRRPNDDESPYCSFTRFAGRSECGKDSRRIEHV